MAEDQKQQHDPAAADDCIDRFTRKVVEKPFCVCLSSICSAFLMTLLMVAGLGLGFVKFELDTSPASFKVTNDPIADRGDAYAVFLEYTTGTSPLGNRTRGIDDTGEGAFDVSVDYYSVKEWFGIPFVYEARGGKPHVEDGVEGANVFEEDAIASIAALEADIRALEGFPSVCVRKPEFLNYTGDKPLLEHCQPVFTATPLNLARPSNISFPVPSNLHCCKCDGSSPVAGDSCNSKSALCEVDESNSGGKRLILRTPDGDGAVGQTAEVMSQLHNALSCDNPALGGALSLEFFVDENFAKSPASSPASATTRGFMRLGGVVDLTKVADATPEEIAKGITTDTKRWRRIGSEYDKVIFPRQKAFIMNELIPLVESYNAELEEDNPVRAAAFSSVHLEYEIVYKGILVAASWSLPAFASVILYMIFHTGSPFLTFMGLGHVLISFPTTWAIYYFIYNIKYQGFLNFISLFVIMGIGADDIFVFTDAWKQSKLEPEEISGSILGRLNWTYRRAAGAMLITSITDACAFYANCISDITVIRIFGAFVGTMVLINFALCVTYFPAIVIIWNKMGWEDSSIKKKTVDSQVTAAAAAPTKTERRHCLQVFCADSFAPTLFRSPKRAAAVLLACLAVTGGGAGAASQLRPSEKDFRAESFPADSNTMRFFSMQNRFATGRSGNAYLAFVVGAGVDGSNAINRANVDPNNPRETGMAVFLDPTPDYSSPEAQRHLIHICETWSQNKLVKGARFKEDPRENGVRCFAKHFRDWVTEMGNTYPVPAANFTSLLSRFTAMPSNTTCHDPLKVETSSDMYKECSAYYKTIHGYPSAFGTGGPLQMVWNDQIRWATSTASVADPQVKGEEMTPEYGPPVIRGFIFEMNFTMEWDVSGIQARTLFDQLERTQNSVNKDAPTGMEGFHVNWQGSDSGSKWMQMRTDEVMQTSAFQGCIVSVVFAILVLTLATANLLLAFHALIAISSIVVCCIGFLHLVGWSFGMIESICVIICVGFSIDFVAHLAVAYNEADPDTGRYGRTKQALNELGVSVTAAAITTAVASAFLLGNTMIPFIKIGSFIMFDIIISLFFAVFMFSALLRLAGPKDAEQGSVAFLCNNCRKAKRVGSVTKKKEVALGGKAKDVQNDNNTELNGIEIRGWKKNVEGDNQ